MKVWGTAAAVVLAMTLAGCGTDDASGGGEPEEPSGDWLTSTAPVETAPLIWESSGDVHLSDGTEVELGGPTPSYVVAGDGVFFVEAESTSDTAVDSPASAAIWFAEPGSEPVDTGLELQADTLRASPDGRFLAGVDVVSGEEDQYGTHLAQVVVLDLQEGREVVRTSESLGDPADDDLADLYEEIPVGIARMTDETAYVDAVDTTLAIDLASGEVADAKDVELPRPGAPESPDGQWTINGTGDGKDQVTGSDGTEVAFEVGAPRRTFKFWADDTTVVGIAGHEDGSSSLLTCTVPDGACAIDDKSTGMTVRFHNGSTSPSVIGLR